MNPFLPLHYCIPDVEAHQWNQGAVYLYGSKDFTNDDVYCSHEYDVFSSTDMKTWTRTPRVFHSEQTAKEKQSMPLFAPDAALIDGKYCLFYCQCGGTEGVAFSDKPEGPFVNPQVIGGVEDDGIDPTVLVDDDGQVYYFWGQMELRGAKLDTTTWSVIPETVNRCLLNREDDGFHEGSSILKRNGIYYMVYADESRGKPTCLGYATSENPLGPYVKKGIVIDNIGCDPSNWNNHGSVAEVNGKWYVFYHRASENSNFSRRTCVEEVTFTEDGLIEEVEMTSQGIEGPIDCLKELNVGYACQLSGNCYLSNYYDGTTCYDYLHDIHQEDTATFKYVDFSANPTAVTLMASSVAYTGTVSVHLDSAEGPEIASVTINRTEGGFDFQPFTATLNQPVDGVHAVCLVCHGTYAGKLYTLKSVQFAN